MWDSMQTQEIQTNPQQSQRSVYLQTFGCQMNVLDSQLVQAQLASLGYRFTDAPDAADIILYNTCSVRDQAEQKVFSRVGLHKKDKANRPDIILGIIGCMAERDGKDMIRKFPHIDIMCGPGELDKLPALIDNAYRNRQLEQRNLDDTVALQGDTHRRSATLSAAEDTLESIDLARSFSPHQQGSSPNSAYVRITRGCNKFCTYCVVPNTRGAEVHRPPSHIIDECKRLADEGVIEVTLLGQTVNHYHYDHTQASSIDGILQPQIGAVVRNRGNTFETKVHTHLTGHESPVTSHQLTTFADLLYQIHEQVPAIQRLRFVTSFPRDFGDDILHVIRDCPRICNYLHMPVQSGSDRILKLMNRGYTAELYRDLIDRINDIVPRAELATDIITGFPTETDEDHQATLNLMRYAKYKNSFIFKYSPRPGTAAITRFEDDIALDVKRQRNAELLALQAELSREIHEKYIGQTMPVFVESISGKAKREEAVATSAADPRVTLGWEKNTGETAAIVEPTEVEPTQLTGRTEHDLIVCFDDHPSIIGSIVNVKIEAAGPLVLLGQRV